jgi:hypothetical protein
MAKFFLCIIMYHCHFSYNKSLTKKMHYMIMVTLTLSPYAMSWIVAKHSGNVMPPYIDIIHNPQCDKITLWTIKVRNIFGPSHSFLRNLCRAARVVRTCHQNLVIILCLWMSCLLNIPHSKDFGFVVVKGELSHSKVKWMHPFLCVRYSTTWSYFR